MKENLKVWLHCSVLEKRSEELLEFQESILTDIADDFTMHVVGITKVIFDNKKDYLYQMNAINHAIRNEKIDAVVVYSKNRISSNIDIYEEFEMFCLMHGVQILIYQELVNQLEFQEIVDDLMF